MPLGILRSTIEIPYWGLLSSLFKNTLHFILRKSTLGSHKLYGICSPTVGSEKKTAGENKNQD